MKKKLLKTSIEAVKPEDQDVLVWDTEIHGFLLKVTPTNRRIYFLDYRFDGRRRRIKLGEHGPLAVDDARRKALETLKQVGEGIDPLTVARDSKEAPTVFELCDEYLERHARPHKKPRSVQDDERLIKDFIKPKLGDLKAAHVTRAHISKLHHDMRETPTTANRTLACLSKMFNLAEIWGYRPDGSNPCRHIQRNKENKRRRFLSIEEIGRLATVLAAEEKGRNDTFAATQAIKLLLFTGMRMGEVLPLEWDWIDLDGQRIELPDSKTGEKTIWLNQAAIEVLKALQEFQKRRQRTYAKKGEPWLGGRWVLPGRRNGQPLVWIESFWRRVRKQADLDDVRIHDLRHTVASIGAAEGLGLPVIGALLGHTQAATTQRYAHVAQSPALAASELIGKRILDAMTGASKVVELNQEDQDTQDANAKTAT